MSEVLSGQDSQLQLDYENPGRLSQVQLGLTIHNQLGVAVTSFSTILTDTVLDKLGASGGFTCAIPALPFPLGHYRVSAALRQQGEDCDIVPTLLEFAVHSTTFYGTTRNPQADQFTCMVAHSWTHHPAI
jgi:hypothetical protein